MVNQVQIPIRSWAELTETVEVKRWSAGAWCNSALRLAEADARISGVVIGELPGSFVVAKVIYGDK